MTIVEHSTQKLKGERSDYKVGLNKGKPLSHNLQVHIEHNILGDCTRVSATKVYVTFRSMSDMLPILLEAYSC